MDNRRKIQKEYYKVDENKLFIPTKFLFEVRVSGKFISIEIENFKNMEQLSKKLNYSFKTLDIPFKSIISGNKKENRDL